MGTILDVIKQSWEDQEQRNWPATYWLVDIHGTILKPDYGNISKEFYPFAKDALQLASKSDIKLIMWTCSTPEDIEQYVKYFAENGIVFDFIGINPDAFNYPYGDYTKKAYANVMLDDKAGFCPSAWESIYQLLEKKFGKK